MSASVAAALKKIAVYVFTDKKAFKTVTGIILGIIIILSTPIIATVAFLNGGIETQNVCNHWLFKIYLPRNRRDCKKLRIPCYPLKQR